MNEKSEYDRSFQLTVPMEPDQEVVVAGQGEKLALELGFDRNAVDELKLAIIEAVINAIEHSKSLERSVFVTFGLKVKEREITVIIRDYGGGFDQQAVEVPDIREKIHKDARKRGWGLTLMRHMMDKVLIQSGPEGTQVTLVKRG